MIKYIATWILVFLVYVLFAGSLAPYTLTTGVIVSTILSVVFANYIVTNEEKLKQPIRLLYLIYYFLKYISIIEFKSHMYVIRKIISMNIRPGIVRVPLGVKSRYARFLVMASITNTPGTVVVDEKDDYFYVNWIDVTTTEPLGCKKEISEEFEHYAVKIFE